MFSSTTTEVSRSIPTARAIPIRVRLLMEMSNPKKKLNAVKMETGMARATRITSLTLRRNTHNTKMASRAPVRARRMIWSMFFSINSALFS